MMPISILVKESVPQHWLHWQKGSQAINVATGVWLLATVVISFGYSGTLLSSLVMKEYEQPIDSVDDLIARGMPLLVPTKTMLHNALLMDPRRSVQVLMKTLAITKPYEPWEGNKDWQDR